MLDSLCHLDERIEMLEPVRALIPNHLYRRVISETVSVIQERCHTHHLELHIGRILDLA